MKIILSGGGTLGPVTPLLAIYDHLKNKYPEAEFLWVGTRLGPERELIETEGLRFTSLSSGKFRRYVSAWNFIDIFRVLIGFFQSLGLIWKENPNVCISAGAYISVPLHWAAWLFGVPTWVHQQDVSVGLANRLMSPFARIITVAIERNRRYFAKRKVVWIGNPVRPNLQAGNLVEAQKIFNLVPGLPVVLAMGGGTGSLRVNQIIIEAVPHLDSICQIIHLSGRERPQELVERASHTYHNYQVHQFLTTELKHAYAAADIVVSRGGFGSLSEIAALKKASILIPKGGHQIENVAFLGVNDAAIYVDERLSSGLDVASHVKELLQNPTRRKTMGERLHEILPAAKEQDVLFLFEKLIR